VWRKGSRPVDNRFDQELPSIRGSEAARTGNWFLETNLVIARLDKLSRNEDVQEKLKAPDSGWT
jgi:hypothetical protein